MTYASTNSDAEWVSRPGTRVFVLLPKRNSVAESIVRAKKRSWRSTVDPSLGIASIKCDTCVSNVSKSAT